ALAAFAALKVRVEGVDDGRLVFVVAQQVAVRIEDVLALVVEIEIQRGGGVFAFKGAPDEAVVALRVGEVLLALVLVAQAGAVGHVAQRADRDAVVDEPGVAGRYRHVHVGIDRLVVFQFHVAIQRQQQFAVDVLAFLPLGLARRADAGIGDARDVRRTDVALVGVDCAAQPVGHLALVAQGRQAVRGILGIPAGSGRYREQWPVRYAARADVDVAAAEGRGLVGGIGLVDLYRLQDRGGKQVQRNDITAQFRRRNLRAVERGAGVALA